jgi:hypothetical protein
MIVVFLLHGVTPSLVGLAVRLSSRCSQRRRLV